MGRSTLSESVRRGIVARILAGKSTAAKEAKAYGLRPGFVRNLVYEMRNKMNQPAKETAVETTEVVTTGTDAPVRTEENSASVTTPIDQAAAAERARVAGNIISSSAGGQPSGMVQKNQSTVDQEALRIADEEDKRFIVESYRDMKEGAIEPVIDQIGLDMKDPRVEKIVKPRMLTEQALKANAGWVAPKVRDKLVGWVPLVVALAVDGIFTGFALRGLVRSVLMERLKDEKKPDEKPAQ